MQVLWTVGAVVAILLAAGLVALAGVGMSLWRRQMAKSHRGSLLAAATVAAMNGNAPAKR